MAVAIDTVNGRGLSNEARHELLPKKIKIMLYQPFIYHYKPFYWLYGTNKMERFSFKSGVLCGLLYTTFITKVLKYKASLNERIKFVRVATV